MKRFKKVVTIMMALAMMSTTTMATDLGETELVASNGIVHFDYTSRPINVNDRVVVPVKYISEMFNALTSYDTTTKVMKIRTVGGGTTEFTVGSNLFKVNGIEREMDVETMEIEGSIYLPLRYALEGLGYTVGWSNANSMAYVDGEANSIQDYRNYGYGFNGDKELGTISFRTKYDCGLQILPGTQTKGTGNSLVEIYYNPSNDINSEYISILNDVFGNQTLVDVQTITDCINNGNSASSGGVTYSYSETPSGTKILKLESNNILTDIQGVKVTNKGEELQYTRIGAIERVKNNERKIYVPLIETANILGKTTERRWMKEMKFSGGEVIDVTNNDTTYVIHGTTYVEINEFNNIFKTELASEGSSLSATN